jgi:hypothetical protein
LKESGDLGAKVDKWDLEDLTTKDNIVVNVDQESTTCEGFFCESDPLSTRVTVLLPLSDEIASFDES